MSYNTTPLVLHSGVRPTWTSSDRFWYRTTSETGQEAWLVDAANRTRVVCDLDACKTPQAGGGSSPEPLSPGSDYALDIERVEKVKFLVGGDIKSLTQAAIRFALMKSEVSTVLVGFSNTAHIDEAVACSGASGLSEEAMARLRKLWETDFGRIKP